MRKMSIGFGVTVLMLVIQGRLLAADGASCQVIPKPLKVQQGEGAFALTEKTVISVKPSTSEMKAIGRYLADLLAPASGVKLDVKAPWFSKSSGIVLTLDASQKDLGQEGYRLVCTLKGVTITAAKPAGVFYGVQTLRQLLPVEVESRQKVEGVAWTAPCVSIEDGPRFQWRGLLLDPARYFITPANVKRMIDLMAMHKLNVLQLHLTDDQGWRVEIKKYPKLTEVGSTRRESPVLGNRNQGDGKPCGGFYTQDDVRDIVAYARARFVTIIPEIEMPGHASAAIAAYPELGNGDVPGFAPGVKVRWGVHYYTLAPSENTFQFIDDVIGEVAALFPDAPYVHIGGDECPKDQWKQSDFAKKVMSDHGLKDGHELQSYFVGRVEKILNAHGKRIVGWDEIQEGGLSSTATMMVWRDWKWAEMAVKHGNDIVMAPTSHTYFDYGQGPKPADPAFDMIGGNLPVEKVYDLDPLPTAFTTPEQVKHVLGCQAQLWGEYAQNQAKIEYLAFPRVCAFSEVVWTSKSFKDKADFMKRLAGHEARLDVLKVNYRKSDGAEAQPGAVANTVTP